MNFYPLGPRKDNFRLQLSMLLVIFCERSWSAFDLGTFDLSFILAVIVTHYLLNAQQISEGTRFKLNVPR